MAKGPQFALGGIPVRVDPTFFVIIALLGINPYDVRPLLVVTWVAIAFGSVLLHELGHAVVFRHYGVRPSITLYGLGGLTSGEGRLTPTQGILVSLAGPVSALVLLGLPAWWLQSSGAVSGADARTILAQVVWINVGWSVLNLLPILPLDGGNVLRSGLDLVTKGRGRRAAEIVSILFAGVLAVLALKLGFVFGAVLAAMFLAINLTSLSKVKQQELGDELTYGHRALIEHRPGDAQRVAEAVLAKRPSGDTLRWASELLAWSRLWQGDLAGADAAMARFAHAGAPSASFRAAQALAAGRLAEGVAVMAWAFANEPPGPTQVLGAIAIAGTGQSAALTDELLRLEGTTGVAAAVLFHRLLEYAGYRDEAAVVASRLEVDGRSRGQLPG